MKKADYVQMFALKPEEQNLRILVCAKGDTEKNLPQAEFIDPHTLPHLSFADQSFNLVLCPNVLFKEELRETEVFVRKVLTELIRVGSEVRVLPLVDGQGNPSEHLGSVIQALQEQGIGIELRQIQLTKEDKPNAMLRIWRAMCEVK